MGHLTKVTSNDDVPVPGQSGKISLVAFNAVAEKVYSLQIGSKAGAEGDIFGSIFSFPPGGGLSVFLSTVGATAWQGRDYVCGYGDPLLGACGNPLFIIHNSTGKTLRVTPSSDLGSGVVAPAAFTLAPNEIKTAKFVFSAAFDKTTRRTVAGHFTFVGTSGGTVVSRAGYRALIAVGSDNLGNVLRAHVTPTVRAGWINEGKSFEVTLTNTGSQTAVDCFARSEPGSRLKTVWRQIDPSSKAFIGQLDQPIDIPAHQSRSLQVRVASQEPRVADPEFPMPVTFDCANTQPAPSDLSNAFDITELGIYRPVQVEGAKLAPDADKLLVPAGGGVFRVSAINRSATKQLRALAIYARPFDECCNASKQFTVQICQTATATSGTCLAPLSSEVNYTATKDAKKFFKIVVKPPTTDPGFDPTKRRVFFKLWQDQPTTGGFDSVVAAASVAVKKN